MKPSFTQLFPEFFQLSTPSTAFTLTGPPEKKFERYVVPILINNEPKLWLTSQADFLRFSEIADRFKARRIRKNKFLRWLESVRLLRPEYCTDMVEAKAMLEVRVRKDKGYPAFDIAVKGVAREDLQLVSI